MTYHIAWGHDLSMPFDEFQVRALAVQLCEYACDGSRGRPERDDSVYDAITERRDCGAVYSSCADLAHWMLYRLGVREYFVNRAEHRGFKYGVNLSRLAWCAFARETKPTDRYSAGDILVIWSRPDTKDAHVTIVLRDGRVDGTGNELETANYGAPGGKISTVPIVEGSFAGKATPKLGTRYVRRWIPLGGMMSYLHAHNRLADGEDVTRNTDGSLIWSANDSPVSGRMRVALNGDGSRIWSVAHV